MSKEQTTGQPKKVRQTQETPMADNWFERLLGNPQDRKTREEALNRLILRTLTVITAIIVVLLGIALFVDQVVIPNQSVASVNGQSISVRDFRDRVRLERAQLSQQLNSTIAQIQAFGIDPNQFLQQEPYSTWINELNVPDQLGRRVLNEMTDDLLVAQEAQKLGIEVGQEQLDQQLNQFFNFDPTAVASLGQEPTVTPTATITPTPFVSPTPSPTPLPTSTPTPLPEATGEVTAEATGEATALPTAQPTNTPSAEELRNDFEENQREYRRAIRQAGNISDGPIDDYFRRQALRTAVGEYLLADKTTTPYVNARHILVATEAQAQEILSALREGASFADLARASSTDTGSGANGGELGWAPASNYVAPFEQAVLSLPIGELSEPIESEFGFHIIQVRAREDREITEEERSRIRQSAFDKWLSELRTANEANIQIFDSWTNYVPR